MSITIVIPPNAIKLALESAVSTSLVEIDAAVDAALVVHSNRTVDKLKQLAAEDFSRPVVFTVNAYRDPDGAAGYSVSTDDVLFNIFDEGVPKPYYIGARNRKRLGFGGHTQQVVKKGRPRTTLNPNSTPGMFFIFTDVVLHPPIMAKDYSGEVIRDAGELFVQDLLNELGE